MHHLSLQKIEIRFFVPPGPAHTAPSIKQLQQQKQGLVSQQIITSILGLQKVKWRLKSF